MNLYWILKRNKRGEINRPFKKFTYFWPPITALPAGTLDSSTIFWVAAFGSEVIKLTTTIATKLTVDPKIPNVNCVIPKNPLPPLRTQIKYAKPEINPKAIPAQAPSLLARFHHTPSTSGQNSPDIAKSKAHITEPKIPWISIAAIVAPAKPIITSNTLATTSRFAVSAFGSIIL